MDYSLKFSAIVSAIITFILTVLFGITVVVIKIPPKETYSVIRINLADNNYRDLPKPEKPEVQKQEAAAASAEEIVETPATPVEQPVEQAAPVPPPVPEPVPVQKSTPAPAPQKTTETKKTSTPTASTKKTETTSSAAKETPAPTPVTPTYSKTQEQLAAEMAANKKQAVWDDSMFDDDDDTPATTTTKTVAASTSSFSGTEATSAPSSSNSTAASSSSKNTSSSSSSSATTNKLSAIAKTYNSSSSSATSSAKMNTAQQDGRTMIQLANNSYRALISPKEPVINISEKAAASIDTDKNVKITFTILANGTVPLNGIIITPDAILTQEVKSEIRAQISSWKFAADTSDGTAIMEYTIKVK